MNLSRRSLLTGFAGLLAAPAIIRASSLMPVRAVPLPLPPTRFVCDYLTSDHAWFLVNGEFGELQIVAGRDAVPDMWTDAMMAA